MEEKKHVGSVTEEEKNEIKTLFERKNGLAELMKSISPDNEVLYEKLVTDMGATATRFQAWWDRMAAKYQWENRPDGRWEINFDTNEVFLN